MSSTPVIVYCDGSALGNPGPGGWCWYRSADCWMGEGFFSPVTNNAMELAALADLLRQAPRATPLLVRMDSRYAIDCVTKWAFSWRRNNWRKADGSPIANRELIEEIFSLRAGRDVTLEWVRAHAGEPGNEAADTKARALASRARELKADQRFGPGWLA